MRRLTAWRSVPRLAVVAMVVLLAGAPAFAASLERPYPCPDRDAEQGAAPSASTALAAPATRTAPVVTAVPVAPPKPRGTLSADERRVVRWLVGEIRRLDGSKTESVDFTAEDVRRGTGVDVGAIDTERVRKAVRQSLAAEAEPSSRPATKSSPDSGASGSREKRSSRDPESQGGGPGGF